MRQLSNTKGNSGSQHMPGVLAITRVKMRHFCTCTKGKNNTKCLFIAAYSLSGTPLHKPHGLAHLVPTAAPEGRCAYEPISQVWNLRLHRLCRSTAGPRPCSPRAPILQHNTTLFKRAELRRQKKSPWSLTKGALHLPYVATWTEKTWGNIYEKAASLFSKCHIK